MLTNNYRSLHSATPIRFTMSSCKKKKYYARSRGAKQPWCSHYNAICTDWVSKHNRITMNYAQERWQNDAWVGSSTVRPILPWSRFKRACSAPVRRTSFPIHLPRHVLPSRTQHFVHPLTFKNAFRARHPSKSERWRCENEAFNSIELNSIQYNSTQFNSIHAIQFSSIQFKSTQFI